MPAWVWRIFLTGIVFVFLMDALINTINTMLIFVLQVLGILLAVAGSVITLVRYQAISHSQIDGDLKLMLAFIAAVLGIAILISLPH
jgi:hypothetical protein